MELGLLSGALERVTLPLGTVICESGAQLRHTYFPTTAIVSLLYVTASGASTETASVGNEGILGTALFLGDGASTTFAIVQTAGEAYRLDPQVLRREFDRAGTLQRLLLRYTQAKMTYMAHLAFCNRHHTVEQQLCRWLLMTSDRLSTTDVIITHEFIASMLGVRREQVTAAAGNLQAAGYIRYGRGVIAVLNRAGLESRVCECYGIVRNELTRLVPHPPEASSSPISPMSNHASMDLGL